MTTCFLPEETSAAGLEVNTNRSKVLNLMEQHIFPIGINEQNIGGIGQYMGTVAFVQSDTGFDVA